jgi:hypothetical protein
LSWSLFMFTSAKWAFAFCGFHRPGAHSRTELEHYASISQSRSSPNAHNKAAPGNLKGESARSAVYSWLCRLPYHSLAPRPSKALVEASAYARDEESGSGPASSPAPSTSASAKPRARKNSAGPRGSARPQATPRSSPPRHQVARQPRLLL